MGDGEEIKIKYKIKWSDQLRVAVGLTEKIRLVRKMGNMADRKCPTRPVLFGLIFGLEASNSSFAKASADEPLRTDLVATK